MSETILERALGAVAGTDFAAFVDLDLGMVIEARPTDFYAPELLETLASAVVNCLEGSAATRLDADLRGATDTLDNTAPYFQEATLLGGDRLLIFLRLAADGQHVLCLGGAHQGKGAGTASIVAAARAFRDGIGAEVAP